MIKIKETEKWFKKVNNFEIGWEINILFISASVRNMYYGSDGIGKRKKIIFFSGITLTLNSSAK